MIWKVQGYFPIPNSIIMQSREWYIEADNYEKAKDKAYEGGARNVFKIEEAKNLSTIPHS